MKITTLLIICLALMAWKCQEPNIVCYSEEEMQIKNDSIKAQNVLLNVVINNCNSAIAELQGRNIVKADSYEYIVQGVSDSLRIRVNKDHLNTTIIITDEYKEVMITYGQGNLIVKEYD